MEFLSPDKIEAILFTIMVAATPFLFAGMGELVAERSGVLNLGVEGMMLMGAVAAFAVAWSTGNSMLAILAGAGAGAAMALIFSIIALSLLANQAGNRVGTDHLRDRSLGPDRPELRWRGAGAVARS